MQTFSSDQHEFSSSESEDDYIDMEVQHDPSFESIFSHTNKEFEFQSFSSSSEKDHQTTTSPADELFYMGKLLPLHLPPRLEMVQKIFQHNFDTKTDQHLEESFKTPLENTPFESCQVSPSESCQASRELNPQEYFLECSSSLTKEKKSWTKKLIKWANIKSLFTKSAGCSYDPRADGPAQTAQKRSDYKPFGQIKYKKAKEEYRGSSRFTHRRSFSGAFKMESKTKKAYCDSSNLSNSTSSHVHHQVLKRSSTVMSSAEAENPIQSAIAHCKKSLDQQQYLILFNKGY